MTKTKKLRAVRQGEGWQIKQGLTSFIWPSSTVSTKSSTVLLLTRLLPSRVGVGITRI
jgi:hypothetical protein